MTNSVNGTGSPQLSALFQSTAPYRQVAYDTLYNILNGFYILTSEQDLPVDTGSSATDELQTNYKVLAEKATKPPLELADVIVDTSSLGSSATDELQTNYKVLAEKATKPPLELADVIVDTSSLGSSDTDALQTKYGVLAENAAKAQLEIPVLYVVEATQPGTTSSLIKAGYLWQTLESTFRNPVHDPDWKYNVSLDEAFKGILDPKTPPKNTDEFVSFLRTSIDNLNLQVGTAGLPAPYRDIAETALQRLEGRNTGNHHLCAWAMSANLRLVMSVIETFGDTRGAKVSDNTIALHEGITLKKVESNSSTGYSSEHGALWSILHSREVAFLKIAHLDEKNIPDCMLSKENISDLIQEMGTGSIVGYVPASEGQGVTLTQAGWNSFCAALGADVHISAFLEEKWPVSDDLITVSELHTRLENLLKTKEEYKHLRYLFSRKLEQVYQELIIKKYRLASI